MGFATSLDICNRGLQHAGVPRIASFTERSRGAQETGFCYDMLRLAELRRNTWKFAIRSARLRPIGTATLQFTPTAWSSGTAYTKGAIVTYTDVLGNTAWWQLYSTSSTADQPDTSPKWKHFFGPITLDVFSASDSYDTAEMVKGSDTNLYLSLKNSNAVNPVGAPAGNWVQLAGTTEAPMILWPAGVGPFQQIETQNLFRLPFGYLRHAPLMPKAGINSYLGMPPAQPRIDWTFEGDYFYTSTIKPVFMRFVADVADVPTFDPNFAEGLGCRIGLEVSPTLTQGPDKTKVIMVNYDLFMGDARRLNAMELGAVFPPLDDYITCRL